MGVFRQSELSGNGSYLAVGVILQLGVIRQWELSGNRNYPAIGVIREWELFGNLSYPAVLTKRLQRRIKRNHLNSLKTDRELAQAVRILTFTGKQDGCAGCCCTVRISTRTKNKLPFFYGLPQFLQADASIVS